MVVNIHTDFTIQTKHKKHVQTVFRKDISITQKKNSCNVSYFEASAFSVLQKTYPVSYIIKTPPLSI